MAKIVQTRRGTTEQHKGFSGQEGEITVDLTESTIRVHDGTIFLESQASGYPLARSDMDNVANTVGIIQLNVSDANAIDGQVLATDGTGGLKFISLSDVEGSTLSGDVAGVIGSTSIQPSAVTTNTVADGNITRDKLEDNIINNAKLEDDAVQTGSILNANVTRIKLEADIIDNTKLDDNAVQTENIVDSNIVTNKIADLNVTRQKIDNDAIDNSKLADNSVQTENIVDGAITNDKIDTIDANKLTGSLSNVDGSNITGLPYDISFLAGYDSETVPTEILVQSYAEMVMGRTGTFEGEVGVMDIAGTGSTVIVDIEKNGVSIYSQKPTFFDSTTFITAGTITTSGFVTGDKVTFKVTQVGSTTAGQGLRFMLKCRV
jgi:hypothetical protein